jgi:hypothetical protein
MTMRQRYGIGIDLGTSNCAIGYWNPHAPHEGHTIPIEQWESPGNLVKKPLLASCLYLPPAGEVSTEDGQLPWQEEYPGYLVGEFARKRGALSPERYIASSKSWLCCEAVDRTQPILPWESSLASKLSPKACAQILLEHLKQAIHQRHPQFSLETEVVLTVPASFDEGARILTVQAAIAAGLSVTLLEEPQAAFYAWIAQNGEEWREQIAPGNLVLVCDVGGGTCDFSLIAVGSEGGVLQLDRISVGQHLLLGGDNMDLALAVALQKDLHAKGTRLDRWQFLALVQQARIAKETLLQEGSCEKITISLAGKGADLFASTVELDIHRTYVEAVLLEGFFPLCEVTDFPAPPTPGGVYELGLRYEAEPAITRHLAKFLHQAWRNASTHSLFSQLLDEHTRGFLAPTHVLFNGGVFASGPMRQRILDVLSQWTERPIRVLDNPNLDMAVAVGAAYYAHSRATGTGIRIAAGTARSYYLGIETSSLAVPGWTPPLKALCIVPQGTKTGETCTLSQRPFGLSTGQAASFRFFSSTTRSGDQTGNFVEDAEAELEEETPLRSTLPPGEGYEKGALVPVTMEAQVTEVGTIELFLQQTNAAQRWKLEFNVQNER